MHGSIFCLHMGVTRMTTQEPITVLDKPEQIARFQVAVYKQGLKALLRAMQVSRGFTSTNCRNFVTNLTGTKYPTGKKGLQLALDDIEAYLSN